MGLRVAKFGRLWNVEEQYKGKPYQGLFFLFKLQRPLTCVSVQAVHTSVTSSVWA